MIQQKARETVSSVFLFAEDGFALGKEVIGSGYMLNGSGKDIILRADCPHRNDLSIQYY